MSDTTETRPVGLDEMAEAPAGGTAIPPAPLATAATTRAGAWSWWWQGLRPLVLRLHFYAGLLVGPFLLVAATTGLLYTLTPQLEQLVYRHELTVPVGARVLPLQQQVAAAAAALPQGTLTAIRPGPTPGGTTRVVFAAPGLADGYSRTVFVDPYTAQVRGTLTTYGEWLPLRAWFDDLHRTLHLGDVGRVYSELAASRLWVLTLSGLGIWAIRGRRAKRLRRTLAPEFAARDRIRLRSWHGSVGLWASAGLLFLSATGLTWSHFAGANVGALRSALHWSTPSITRTLAPAPTTAAAPSAAAAGAAGIGAAADRVLAAARSEGLTDPVQITPASKPGQAWVVAQVQRSWPEKQDSVAVDPHTGTVVDVLRFADWPIAAKLARWGIDTHMGLLFGVVNQILLAALALGLICVVIWGYRMWWLRRPTPGGLAGAPGGNARTSLGAVIVIGILAVGVGLFEPVLGCSLLAFLAIDGIRSHLQTGAAPRV
ncbi:PepSY domain-containing protein [Pseudonocardia sp.]|uniref:PepSY-associated TM helix domain-containing protein n=1 Tax=Pseudonocardia sp. TaxID=60912 RepID=UPI0026120CEB|nr:PepSY-associated TM helix domain-containing protein [Pseudonocardia sp.]MCW2722828.1 hypothetical protein [Pseudonocardia sp.]